ARHVRHQPRVDADDGGSQRVCRTARGAGRLPAQAFLLHHGGYLVHRRRPDHRLALISSAVPRRRGALSGVWKTRWWARSRRWYPPTPACRPSQTHPTAIAPVGTWSRRNGGHAASGIAGIDIHLLETFTR